MEYCIDPEYGPVMNPPTRRIDMCGGRGAGRSFMLSLRAYRDLVGKDYSVGAYLRQYKNSHRYSTFEAVKQRIAESGLPKRAFSINNTTLEIVCTLTGNKLIFLGAHGAKSDNSRLKSLEGVNKLYAEEATEIGREDLLKIRLSLRTRKGDINEFYAYNPPDPKHHLMLYDYQLTPSEERFFDNEGQEVQVYNYAPKIPNLTLVRTNYLNNIHNLADSTVDEMEALRQFDLPTYLSTVRGFVGGLPGGVVYRHFMPVEAWEFAIIPRKSFYVLDFGYSQDPCCLLECKYHNGALYVKELIYGKMDDLTLAKRMLDCGIRYTDTIIADYGNGGDVRINTLRSGGGGAWTHVENYPDLRNGFSVIYAKKGAGSVLHGIQLVKSIPVYVCADAKHVWKESRNYVWATDANGETTGNPVDKDNHAMDCIRYAASYVSVHGAPV